MNHAPVHRLREFEQRPHPGQAPKVHFVLKFRMDVKTGRSPHTAMRCAGEVMGREGKTKEKHCLRLCAREQESLRVSDAECLCEGGRLQ